MPDVDKVSTISFAVRSLCLLLSVVLGALCAPAIGKAEGASCKAKIGFLLPLTGPASLIGERSEQAARLAYDELSPQLRARLSLVFEDTEMKSLTGVKATMKLLGDSEIIGLSGFGSETVSAIAEMLEKRKVPGVFVTPDRTPLIGKQFVFRHWVDGQDMQNVLFPLLKSKGVTKLAIVYSELPAMQGFAATLSATAPAAAFEIVSNQNVLPSETDFRTIITSTINAKPQVIFFFLLPPQTSMFMKQLRSAEKSIPVYSYINTENSHELKAADGALEGVTYAGPKFSEEFIKKFSERFHEYPEFAAGNIYDIVHILAKGVEQGACTRTELQTWVAQLNNFDGALGHYGVKDGNDFRFPVSAKQIVNGRFQFLESGKKE